MWLRFKAVFLIVCSLVFLSIFPSSSFSKNNPFCGPDVLSVIYKNYGIKASLHPLERIASKQYGLTSYADLIKEARQNKLRTFAFKDGDIALLRSALQDGFVIIHDKGHFSLIEKVDDKAVHIYTPGYMQERYAMSLGIFQRHWDGYGLLVSKDKIKMSSRDGQFVKLTKDETRGILGAVACYNSNGAGSLASGVATGNGAPSSSSPVISANNPAPTTLEPVYLQNGALYQTANDITVPALGMPLQLTRYYNSQTISEVEGWIPEPGAGSWTIEGGQYSGEGDRSFTKDTWSNVTIELDMQTIQPGTSFPWETGWVNFRYTDEQNRYYVLIRTDGLIELAKRKNLNPNDPPTVLVQTASAVNPLVSNHVKVQDINNVIKVWVNGNLYINFTDTAPITAAGRVGLESQFSHVHYDNVSIIGGGNTKFYDFAQDDNDFIFGYGWSSSYSMRVKEYADHVTVIHDNSARHVYFPAGGGSYTPSIFNTYDILTKDVNGFKFTTKHKTIYRFDLSGRLQYIEDRNGNRTTLSYTNISGSLKLTGIQSDGTRALTLSYGPNNLVDHVTDPAGNQTNYVYNPSGYLTEAFDRRGKKVKYTYDPVTRNMLTYKDKELKTFTYTYGYNDHVLTQTDPYNNVTTFDYNWDTTQVSNDKGEQFKYNFDANIFLQAIEDPNLVAETMLNNANGDRTDHWDRNNNHTTYTYNTSGDLKTLTDAKAKTQEWPSYNSFHFPLSYKNARGYTTTYTYDPANGNLTKITDALTKETNFTYTTEGYVDTITDARGYVTDFNYNAEGDMIEKIAPGSRHTYYGYSTDNLGRLTSVTNALTKVTTFTYNKNGDLLTIKDPLLNTTKFEYSDNGYLTKVIDPLLHETIYTYDSFGNVMTVKDDNNKVVNQTYDRDNQMHLGTANLTQLLDQKGSSTDFEYDPMNQLTKSTDAQNQDYVYTYDQQGNLITRTDAMGQITGYAYDELNRLVSIDYPSGPDVSFVLDANGNKVEVHDTLGITYLTYDALDRLTQVLRPDGYALNYVYDAVGNRTKVAYPSGMYVQYVYSSNNEITQVKRNGVTLVQYTYDKLSRMIKKQQFGVIFSYTYDAANRLLSIKQAGANLFTYTYDNAGNRTTVTGIGGNYQYTYDSLDQLVGTTGAAVHNYTYDAAGNRMVVDGSTYVTNNLNQYTSGGGSSYTYNDNGNMITKGTWTYGYDEENRLISANKSGTAATYVYDGLGRRIKKTVNGTVTKYIYDGDRVIAEYNNTGTLKAEYIYGIGIDEVVTMDRNSVRYNYVYDGLGSVAKLVNNSGVNVETYTYNPYGVPTAISSVGNPYLFTGREYDSETSLYNYRARTYNAAIGRFLQRDPIGHYDDVNLYSYVHNNPINWIDPWGWEALPVPISEDLIFFFSGTGVALWKGFLSAGYRIVLWEYENSSGLGLNLLKNGKRILGLDWHKFKINGKWVNLPHIDIPGIIKHWPWGQ